MKSPYHSSWLDVATASALSFLTLLGMLTFVWLLITYPVCGLAVCAIFYLGVLFTTFLTHFSR